MSSQLPLTAATVTSQCGYCTGNVPVQRQARALLHKQLLFPSQPVVDLPARVSRPVVIASEMAPAPYLNVLPYLSRHSAK